jgi:hypothetical protein
MAKKKRVGKKNVFKAAKAMRKKHPRKYSTWQGYVKAASGKRSPAKKRRKKKRTRKVAAKRKPVTKRKKKPGGRHLVKYVERASTERVMNGRKKKRCHCAHRAYLAGSRRRRRSVGGLGSGAGLLVGLGIGALGIYLLTRKPSAATTPTTTLPPIQQTGNTVRDSQSQDLINYAIAGGLAISAITSLIDKLNNSTDDEVQYIYDNYGTTGDIGALALV